jgi:hypothetical protein
MRLRELSEAISLSAQTPKVRKIINDAIIKSIKVTYKYYVEKQIESGDITDNNDLTNVLAGNLPVALETYIGNDLIVPYPVKDVQFVDIKTGAEGQAANLVIKIHNKFINQLAEKIAYDIANSPDIFSRDDDNTLHADTVALKYSINSYVPKNQYDIQPLIVKLSDIFIHELVHVYQHRTQQHRVVHDMGMEYRSYLAKNKQQFYDELAKDKSELRGQFYHASPQEIPAFAHNAAMQLIDTATMDYDIETMDQWDLQATIINLEDIIKDARNWRWNEFYQRYADYNKPDSYKHYQVYKRFMTALYKEIQSFKAHVQQRLDYVKSNPEPEDEY